MRLFLNTMPDTLWSGVSCLRYTVLTPFLWRLILTLNTDSLFLPFPHGSFHVAQFLMVQSHVYLLACCSHWLDGCHNLPAGPSITPQESQMVCFFECEFSVIPL